MSGRKQLTYKGAMRLAFEEALRMAGLDAGPLERAPAEKAAPVWTGPRDRG